jgi:hypothetical protein
MNPFYFRIILNFIVAFSILFMPWWLTSLLIIFGIFGFNNFYESILWAFVMDGIYAIPLERYSGYMLVYTSTIVGFFIISIYLKKIIKFYSRS